MLYSAPLILTLSRGVLRDSTLRVSDRKITDVGSRSTLLRQYTGEPERYFPETVLMPGLINAHTHLEDGSLRERLSHRINPAEWQQDYVIGKKGLFLEDCANAVHLGALESLRNGTTTLFDVSAGGAAFRVLYNERIRSVIFLEFTSSPEKTMETTFHQTLSLAEGFMGNDICNWGVAFSALLTQEDSLLRQGLNYAVEQNVPLLHHAEAGLWGGCPTTLLPRRTLGVNLWPCEKGEFKELTGMSVVVCPRSLAQWRKPEDYPLRRLLEKGVNVCIGTESLAQVDSLDLFEDLNLLKRAFPALKSESILRLSIQGGARAIGLSGVLGQIRPGFLADIIAVRTGTPDPDFICDSLLLEEVEVVFVMVNGREILV